MYTTVQISSSVHQVLDNQEVVAVITQDQDQFTVEDPEGNFSCTCESVQEAANLGIRLTQDRPWE